MRLLRKFSRDESLVVILKVKAGKYADALARCLPMDEFIQQGKKYVTLPGCYYTRKLVTGKTDKALFTAAMELLIEASAKKDREKKWLALYLLEGLPVPVSNFELKCLYLLRDSRRQRDAAGAAHEYKGRSEQGRRDWRRGHPAQ